MENEYIYDLINAIREDKEMDFIASHYNQFSKDELMTIIREYMYAYYLASKKGNYSIEEIIEELEEKLL